MRYFANSSFQRNRQQISNRGFFFMINLCHLHFSQLPATEWNQSYWHFLLNVAVSLLWGAFCFRWRIHMARVHWPGFSCWIWSSPLSLDLGQTWLVQGSAVATFNNSVTRQPKSCLKAPIWRHNVYWFLEDFFCWYDKNISLGFISLHP